MVYRSFLYRYRFIGSPFLPPISLPFALRHRSWLEEDTVTVPIIDETDKPTVAVVRNLTVTDSFIRGDNVEILHKSPFFYAAVQWVLNNTDADNRSDIAIIPYIADKELA